MPVRSRSISSPQAAVGKQRGVGRKPGDMVEQMLDLDRIAGRQGEARDQAADPVGQAQAPFGSELVNHGRGHLFGDRSDLEQGVAGDRRAFLGIGKTGVEGASEPIGRGHSERHSGKREILPVRLAVRSDRG